ncbi:MAG: asparagine synthase (glutamine-hydrolyzing), partial [Planctomycetia bacterium]
MCGIAGFIGFDPPGGGDRRVLRAMATAILHRGPDEEGLFLGGGVGLASRRLSIVDLAGGRQPVFSEDRGVVAVFNGELFDHPEVRDDLQKRGHVFRSRCDSELLVHLWEEYGEEMVAHTRGQFAFALYDQRRRTVVLARDRVGICPLHWARHGRGVLFGSEIKAILASGLVAAEVDHRGLDHVLTFFATPTKRTSFRGVQSLDAGTYLKIQLDRDGAVSDVVERRYWDLDFPDAGQEDDPTEEEAVGRFGAAFERAVALRLRGDVPVAGYLSGGVDSAAVLAQATRLRGEAPPSFTIKVASRRYDEEDKARAIADYLGSRQTVVTCDAAVLDKAYPALVRAADCPVVDTACAALYVLADEVRRQGYKVVLTGEGADEALAGYPWFKTHQLMGLFDRGSFRPSDWMRRAVIGVAAPTVRFADRRRTDEIIGASVAQADLYTLMSANRRRFFHADVQRELGDFTAFEELPIDRDRLRRWDPLNRSLYVGYKTILPGLLVSQKGDRVAMANSVEARYPFLDEEVVALSASLAP